MPFLPMPGPPMEKRVLINDFTGVVRDGEMLLVLGRPGSGCSTFLKTISNKRGGYAGVEGDVSYGGIPAEEQAQNYRGEVNYNEEVNSPWLHRQTFNADHKNLGRPAL